MPHKLLLADDSITIQRVIELTFADEDVQVIAVGNGQEAMDRVQRDRPDIILADVGMPERNGYEVAAFVKGNPATAHIPVVLLAGAFEPVDEGRARSAGCDGVLVKPFEPQIVISRVKELLAGRQPSGMWGTSPQPQAPVRQASAGEFNVPQAAGRPASRGADPLEAYFDHLDAAFASAGSGPAPDPFAGIPPVPAAEAATRSAAIPLSKRPVPDSQGFGQATKATGNDPFADWDPDLMGDPSRPAPLDATLAFTGRATQPRPAPMEAAAPAATVSPQASAPVPHAAPAAAVASAHPPPQPAAAALPASLVDAFAALLAAEQKMGLTPSAATAASASASGSAPAPAPAPVITDEMLEAVAARVLARLTEQSRPTILDVAERLVRDEIERIKQNS